MRSNRKNPHPLLTCTSRRPTSVLQLHHHRLHQVILALPLRLRVRARRSSCMVLVVGRLAGHLTTYHEGTFLLLDVGRVLRANSCPPHLFAQTRIEFPTRTRSMSSSPSVRHCNGNTTRNPLCVAVRAVGLLALPGLCVALAQVVVGR